MNDSHGSIIVAGSGITLGHLTLETQHYIKLSDIVLYVLTDIVTETWVKENSKKSESMKGYYEEGVIRIHTYNRMTNRVLDAARQGSKACALFYGHPGIFVTPSHNIIKLARAEGIPAKMLPGISAEDCMIADLGFDPGTTGCQAFEATDFLVFKRKPETSAWLIIWQPESVGDLAHTKNRKYVNQLEVLRDYLLTFYTPNTPIVSYEANTYVIGEPKIEWSEIQFLCEIKMTGITTLAIPPTSKLETDTDIMKRLGINQQVLQERMSNY